MSISQEFHDRTITSAQNTIYFVLQTTVENIVTLDILQDTVIYCKMKTEVECV